MYNSYQYIIANEGIDTAKSYGYEERVKLPRRKFNRFYIVCVFYVQQSYCKYATGGRGAQITGFIQISSGNERDLQTAVAYVGPVAVSVDASNPAFRVGSKSFL